MSILFRSAGDIWVVTDDPTVSYPNWQADHEIAMSKSVDGHVATLACARAPVGASFTWGDPTQVTSFDWNGIQFCTAHTIGVGFGYNIYIQDFATLGNQQWAPTDSGGSNDQLPLVVTSNVLAVGLNNAAGTGMTRISKPAYWQRGNQSPPLIPGSPPLNTRDLADIIVTQTIDFGLSGVVNDHIISWDSSIVIPTDPVIQAHTSLVAIPLFAYSPNYAAATSFDTQTWVDFTTGATRAHSPGQTSTTEVLMNCRSDGTAALAVVVGPGVLASGDYRGFSGTGTFGYGVCYGIPLKSYPSGIPAGTVHLPAALCFGTVADLTGPTGAIVTAAANLAAASYP